LFTARSHPNRPALLELAIPNQRKAKRLLKDWEVETERLIDAEVARKPQVN
jgi:hypothetical protein